jgi:HEPN domain-containing protein
MTDRQITKYIADWFVRADEDLDVAQLILEEERPYNPACFHEQQAAEKYLKGFLAYYSEHVRKIHDLDALLQECVKIDQSFESLQDNTQYLNRFYIESRYPDDYVEFTREDAEKGFEAAIRIKEFVLGKIESSKN